MPARHVPKPQPTIFVPSAVICRKNAEEPREPPGGSSTDEPEDTSQQSPEDEIGQHIANEAEEETRASTERTTQRLSSTVTNESP
jgi:hypothetical protein